MFFKSLHITWRVITLTTSIMKSMKIHQPKLLKVIRFDTGWQVILKIYFPPLWMLLIKMTLAVLFSGLSHCTTQILLQEYQIRKKIVTKCWMDEWAREYFWQAWLSTICSNYSEISSSVKLLSDLSFFLTYDLDIQMI